MNFSIFIQEANKGRDNRYPISIRLYHNGKNKYISTIYRAPRSAFDKNMKLKDVHLLGLCSKIIISYEEEIKRAGASVGDWSADEVKEYLTRKKERISFTDFTLKYIDRIKKEQLGTSRNIKSTLNSVTLFSNKENLLFTDITAKFLKDYEEWLLNNGVKGRGVSFYTGYIRGLFNEARNVYNDEEKGLILVPYPFKKYKIPKPPATKKRALNKESILSIYNYKPSGGRDEIARDMFILSFLLIGMNSIDLYNFPPVVNGRITYNRSKTKARREDKAEISIKVEPEAVKIIKKYEKHPYSYSTSGTFNAAINKGLKIIGSKLGIEGLTFYAARHSWATIAVNDCSVPKSDVHEALNHVDPVMRVTDIYIRKDWSRIDRANRKVIDYVFLNIDQ